MQSASAGDKTDPQAVETFIARWEKSGGSESANFQMFAAELCGLLGLPRPDPSEERERTITTMPSSGASTSSTMTAARVLGRIDLYKRGCFVMEAKQSSKAASKREESPTPASPSFLPEDVMQVRAGAATRGALRLGQGRCAPPSSRRRAMPAPCRRSMAGRPSSWSSMSAMSLRSMPTSRARGRTTPSFPDRDGYSIPLEGLRDPDIRARLRAVWTDPQSLEPGPA